MTAQEMKAEFLVGYDKVASLSAPGYIDTEISTFLSQAQERFVKQRYHNMGNKYKEGFEETEKRRKDLAEVTKSGVGTVATDQTDILDSNGIVFDLPTDHWLTTVELLVTDDSCEARKKVIPITYDEYLFGKDNPYRRPNDKEAWRLDLSDNRHEIVTDGTYNITEYKLRYIKTLTDIDITNAVDSELHPMTHREIVNMAVSIALENSQEPRFKTQTSLGQRAE